MKRYQISFLAICLGVLVLSSCTKPKNNTIADPDAKQHNEDVNNTKNESDNLNNDVNGLLNELPGFKKKESALGYSICGASIDSSHQYDVIPYVIITFDGTTACGNPARIRGGQVKVEMVSGAHWSDAGARLKITHTNYKVTFVNLNNHYVTFNGVKYLTNVTGFNWAYYVQHQGSLSATITERSDNMQVTFENGQVESWNCARRSTWDVTNWSEITATVNGDSISNGNVIDSWGTTRFGTTFTTKMITPWKSGTACGWWKPTQGKYTSNTDNFTITATASVNQSGDVVSGCGGYGYKIEWNYQNGTATGDAVIPYF